MNKPFKYFFLLLILFCCEAKTQTNLVYNGDFEIYDTCPNIQSQPYTNQIKYCLGWDKPTAATSDYYNACDNSTFFKLVGVPQNAFGFQEARSGNGYCGFYTHTDTIWYEYITGTLNQQLKNNQKYILRFYLSLAEISRISSSKIGAYFSNNAISLPTYSASLNFSPQVKNLSGNFLFDTLNWMKVEGEFIANGGEKYITIGAFGSNLNSDTLTTNMYYGNPQECYYYIDDVELYESNCSEIIPNIFTPNQDGINDFFKVTICDKIMKTIIYNRWGNKVFETEKDNHYWDGRTTSGIECDDGTYFYILETKEKNIKGFVQLIR